MSHNLHPAWRGQGIGRAMLNWQENRARAIAGHDTSRPQHLQGYATEGNRYLAGLLEANDYQASRYFQMRVRPTLDDIPDVEKVHVVMTELLFGGEDPIRPPSLRDE